MCSTLGLDDAEQALFVQHWLLSYRFRAPPLFTWALVGIGQFADIGMLAISLLRYLLLGMVLAFTYLTARRLIRDPVLAALATFSFTAVYVFGYYSHHDLTHTTTLSAFLAASWQPCWVSDALGKMQGPEPGRHSWCSSGRARWTPCQRAHKTERLLSCSPMPHTRRGLGCCVLQRLADEPPMGLVVFMRYVIAMLGLLACLDALGCAPNVRTGPPDSVLDPRGQ